MDQLYNGVISVTVVLIAWLVASRKDVVVVGVVVGEGFASWFPAVGFLLRESVHPSVWIPPLSILSSTPSHTGYKCISMRLFGALTGHGLCAGC